MAGTHLTYFCTDVACGHSWSARYGDQRIWQSAPWPDEAERERQFNERVRGRFTARRLPPDEAAAYRDAPLIPEGG